MCLMRHCLAYGTNNGINHYEIVMPNPVDEFAYGKVKEGIGIDEKNVEIVENSRRYSLPNRIKTILAFGTRSMNGSHHLPLLGESGERL